MATAQASIDTGHVDMIHDAQLDYYGRRLATASSDKTVRIFDVAGDQQTLTAELRGHEGPVWEVAWAHPKFGNLLATCSYDRKVIIWKETASGWENVKEHTVHDSSVNSIAWAPHETDKLVLACASSDSDISILTCSEGQWESKKISKAHQTGVLSVSWLPVSATGGAASDVLKLVSGGCDHIVKIWKCSNAEWQPNAEVLQAHTDWVRDVAASPSVGLSTNTLASCSQDGNVFIWTQDKSSEAWSKCLLGSFGGPVWRVSWSVTGNLLAVSASDNKVTLWKESLTGEWSCVSEVEDGASQAGPNDAAPTSTAPAPAPMAPQDQGPPMQGLMGQPQHQQQAAPQQPGGQFGGPPPIGGASLT